MDRSEAEPTVAVGTTAVQEAALQIRQAQHGHGVAWESLVRQHQEIVFRLAYLLLGDAAAAEDVAQETFVRAYLGLPRFDAQRPFRPWLLQITRNLARNQQRSQARYLEALKRWWQAKAPSSPAAPDDAQLLWQAVRRLRPPAQEVIYLRYFLEMSEAETAVALAVPPGTVKSRLHRALGDLKAVIETEFVELTSYILSE